MSDPVRATLPVFVEVVGPGQLADLSFAVVTHRVRIDVLDVPVGFSVLADVPYVAKVERTTTEEGVALPPRTTEGGLEVGVRGLLTLLRGFDGRPGSLAVTIETATAAFTRFGDVDLPSVGRRRFSTVLDLVDGALPCPAYVGSEPFEVRLA